MKRFLFFNASSGRNIQVSACKDAEAESLAASLDAQFVEVGEGVTDSTHYVYGGALVPFPKRPSNYHVWDWGRKEWSSSVPGLEAARSKKRQEIDDEKMRLLSLPISYEGVLFDADAESISNIRGISSRIARGDGLTEGWTGWRVADNSMVWVSATASEVFDHLNTIASLIENRTQAVLNAAWAHKDAVAALEDVADVVGYDISLGWPS